MTGARAIGDRLRQLTLGVAMVCLALILVLTLTEIVARAAGQPTSWALDGSSYLLCLSVGASFPVVTAEGSHAAVRLLEAVLRPRVAIVLNRAVNLIAALACAATAILLYGVIGTQYAQGLTTLTTFVVPKWPLTAALLYGFALSAAIHGTYAFTGGSVPEGDK